MAEVTRSRINTPDAQVFVSGMFRIRALCPFADNRATSLGVPLAYSSGPGLNACDL
jgi:hypothetical protein